MGIYKIGLKETNKQISNKKYVYKHDVHFSLFQM